MMTTRRLSPHLLSQASGLIASIMGLHFPEARWDDLEREIMKASVEFGFDGPEAFVDWLRSSALTREHIERLAGYLTIGETYFFRDKETFEALEQKVIPELIASRQDIKRIRVWSAGCSTGEEPYSIAMLLKRLLPDLERWNITILATDINTVALKRASQGVYTEWSFRGAEPWIKENYFRRTRDGHHYEIMPSIREMVTFGFLNLAEDAFPSLLGNTNAMDMIFCRNVLMYFSGDRARAVVKGFYNSLVDGGWLMVSPTDAIKYLTRMFTVMNYPGTILYRKSGRPLEAESRPHALMRTAHGEKKALEIPAPQGPFAEPPPPATEAAPAVMEEKAPSHEKKIPGEKSPEKKPYDGAEALFLEGRYEEAAEAVKKAFSAEDADPRGSALLARAYANMGRLDLALEWCGMAVRLEVLNPGLHYLLATILQEQGRMEEAVSSLKKALYLDNDFVLAYFVLGNILLRSGDKRAAVKHLDNASRLLSRHGPEDPLPESEGMTAGRLSEIISSMNVRRKAS